MKKIVDYLQQLDLSETEAQIYLSLLKTGPLSVRELARTVGAKRTSVYLYIDRLMDKGLITKQVKKSKTEISANEPKESLQMLVEQKIQEDKDVEQQLPDIANTLDKLFTQVKQNSDAEIKYYKGKNGIKKIYYEALKAKELRSYVNIAEITEIIPENFKLFDNAFKENPSMKMYEIVEDSSKARERTENSTKNNKDKYFFKIFPKNMKITSTDILIYDGKVSIINLKDKINGIILRNSDLYNNFKMIFDFIWNILPESK